MGPVGFLGVGTIAGAMVKGLRQQWPDLPLILSPRSETTSRALAGSDPSIRRAAANTAVVEASRVVVLSMLPPQLDDAVRGLPFRAEQTVVSCVASAPLDQIAPLIAPARACRLLPLPTIARREGPIVLYPVLPDIHELFAGLGDLVEAGDERAFAAYAVGSAAMSTFFGLQASITRWIAGHGATPDGAAVYVRSLFRALSETAVQTGDGDLPSLLARHETPGGLNERVRRSLEAKDWFAAPGAAFDTIAGLGRSELATGE